MRPHPFRTHTNNEEYNYVSHSNALEQYPNYYHQLEHLSTQLYVTNRLHGSLVNKQVCMKIGGSGFNKSSGGVTTHVLD